MENKTDFLLVRCLNCEGEDESDIYINVNHISYLEVAEHNHFYIVLFNEVSIEVDAIDFRKALLNETLSEKDVYKLVPQETIEELINNK